MALSAADLHLTLEQIRDSARSDVEGREFYFPTVILANGDELKVIVLEGKHVADELRARFYLNFGKRLANRNASPEAIFVVELMSYRDNRKVMLVSGCGRDGKRVFAGFVVTLDDSNLLRPGANVQLVETPEEMNSQTDGSPTPNAAADILAGFIENTTGLKARIRRILAWFRLTLHIPRDF